MFRFNLVTINYILRLTYLFGIFFIHLDIWHKYTMFFKFLSLFLL